MNQDENTANTFSWQFFIKYHDTQINNTTNAESAKILQIVEDFTETILV